MINLILIGVPFFRSVSQGWLDYYNKSSGPKFTEDQIRQADNVANTLNNCPPPPDQYIDSMTHLEICKSLRKDNVTAAIETLEADGPNLDLTKAGCIEALKIGVVLLSRTAPESIRLATLNLLACDYYYPMR